MKKGSEGKCCAKLKLLPNLTIANAYEDRVLLNLVGIRKNVGGNITMVIYRFKRGYTGFNRLEPGIV